MGLNVTCLSNHYNSVLVSTELNLSTKYMLGPAILLCVGRTVPFFKIAGNCIASTCLLAAVGSFNRGSSVLYSLFFIACHCSFSRTPQCATINDKSVQRLSQHISRVPHPRIPV